MSLFLAPAAICLPIIYCSCTFRDCMVAYNAGCSKLYQLFPTLVTCKLHTTSVFYVCYYICNQFCTINIQDCMLVFSANCIHHVHFESTANCMLPPVFSFRHDFSTFAHCMGFSISTLYLSFPNPVTCYFPVH